MRRELILLVMMSTSVPSAYADTVWGDADNDTIFDHEESKPGDNDAYEIRGDVFDEVELEGADSLVVPDPDVPWWWSNINDKRRIPIMAKEEYVCEPGVDVVANGDQQTNQFAVLNAPGETNIIARNLHIPPTAPGERVKGVLTFCFDQRARIVDDAHCDDAEETQPMMLTIVSRPNEGEAEVRQEFILDAKSSAWEHQCRSALIDTVLTPNNGQDFIDADAKVRLVLDGNDNVDGMYLSNFSYAFYHSVDTDGDGVPNYEQLDSDADGRSDEVENAHPTDSPYDADSDGDGFCDGAIDVADVCVAEEPTGTEDSDADDTEPDADLADDDVSGSDGVGDDDDLADDDDDDVADTADVGSGQDDIIDDDEFGDDESGDGFTVGEDTDGDGIPDSVEDRNGNGIKDDGETSPINPDTDQDGLCDGSKTVPGECTGGEDLNNDGDLGTDPGETNPLVPNEAAASDEAEQAPACTCVLGSSSKYDLGLAMLLVGVVCTRRRNRNVVG